MPTKIYLKRLKRFFCALFLFFTSSIFAQNTSLKKDSIHLYSYKTLDSLARKNYFPNPGLSKKYAEISLRKAQIDKNDERIANALVRIGMMEAKFNRFENALQLIDSAITIVKEKIGDKNKEHEYLFFKGNLHYEKGDYIHALEYFDIVQRYKKSINETSFDRDINHNIAIIKSQLEHYEEAIQLLKENYNFLKEKEEIEKTNFHPTLYLSTLVLLNIAYINTAEKEKDPKKKNILIDSANYYNSIGFEKSIFYDKRDTYNYFVYAKGRSLYLHKNDTEAIKKYKEALKRAIEIPQNQMIPSIYLAIGKSYERLNDFENAIAYFKQLDSITDTEGKSAFIKASMYASLANIYIEKKDISAANKYLKLLIESKNESSAIANATIEKIHELYDINVLKDRINVLSEEIEKKQNWLQLSIVSIITIVFLFIILVFYQRKKKRKNQLLFHQLMQELKSVKKQETTVITKATSITVNDEKVTKILKALDAFEEKKQFLNINCDLAFVAKKVKTNKAYLSKVIHEEKQQKFIQYITTLRIEYALQQLQEDKTLQSYTISAIATELGFKSTGTFTKAFKKKTGLLPSYYIKKIKAKKGSF